MTCVVACDAYLDRAQRSPWQVLMARGPRILVLSSRWELLELAAPYDAIGAGRFVAYGALHAWAQRADLALEEKVERVLEAVCEHVPGIRGPFVIEST